MKKFQTALFIVALALSVIFTSSATANAASGQVVEKTKTVTKKSYRKGRWVTVTSYHHGKKVTKKVWRKGNHWGHKAYRKTKHVMVGEPNRTP